MVTAFWKVVCCFVGGKDEPEPYIMPTLPTSPSPAPVASSPSKGKGKDKGKDKPLTPEPSSQAVDEIIADDEPEEEPPVVEQPFQQLFVSCPDGLNISYLLESSVGKAFRALRNYSSLISSLITLFSFLLL